MKLPLILIPDSPGWPIAVAAFSLVMSASIQAQPTDKASQEALFLLQQSISQPRDQRQLSLLPGLRLLKDPALKPIFTHLARSQTPVLQVHGILALGELSTPPQIDLALLAQVQDPQVEALLIAQAMDNDLLSPQQAAAVLEWSDLGIGGRLIIATRLIGAGNFERPELIRPALAAPKLGQRGVGALLLHQLGDEVGSKALAGINAAANTDRDAVRSELLKMAVRHNFHRAADWAYGIALEDDVHRSLQLIALRAAMRFGHADGLALWRERFDAASDSADKARLAFLALELAPYLPATLFEPLAHSEHVMLSAIGRAGQAVAGKPGGQSDVVEQLVALVELHHPLSTGWIIEYCQKHAAQADARLILRAVILSVDQVPAQDRAQQVDLAIAASRILADMDSQGAINVLGWILGEPGTSRQLSQAILLGLLRSKQIQVGGAIAQDSDFNHPKTQLLALLLRARAGLALERRQMQDLAMLAGNSTQLPPDLRLQAGWEYLKRTGQADNALQQILLSTP